MLRIHRGRPTILLIALPALAWSLGGCTALSLAQRGAPEEAMKSFAIEMAAVNLDASSHADSHEHPATTQHPSTADSAMFAHDHGAPDHDIDEHIAFLEMQAALETNSAMAEVHYGVEPQPLRVGFPEDGWVHGFDFEAVDAAGRVLPADVVHHFQVLVPDRRELFHPIMLRIAGAGGETQPSSLPPEVGYRVNAGDSLVFTGMLHNPTNGPLGDVRLRVRLHYSPEARTWRAPADVVPFFAHVTGMLEDTSYDLPPGRSERAIDVRPAVSGQVLAMGGHLHRYGVSLRIEEADSGDVLWETVARRAADGTVLEVPNRILLWRGSFALVAGRPYRVVAVYENPTGRTLPLAGMGTVGGIVRPLGDWPEVDRSDPAYQWDEERMLGSGGADQGLSEGRP